MMASTPSFSAKTSASASVSRPSASVLSTWYRTNAITYGTRPVKKAWRRGHQRQQLWSSSTLNTGLALAVKAATREPMGSGHNYPIDSSSRTNISQVHRLNTSQNESNTQRKNRDNPSLRFRCSAQKKGANQTRGNGNPNTPIGVVLVVLREDRVPSVHHSQTARHMRKNHHGRFPSNIDFCRGWFIWLALYIYLTSMVFPLEAVRMSPGRMAFSDTMFSQAATMKWASTPSGLS